MSSLQTHNVQKTPVSVKAVIVTYHPDVVILAQLLEALAPQIDGGVIVDNGATIDRDEIRTQEHGFSILPMTHNIGVAGAINRGIEWAMSQGASHVILFDQDSTPSHDMVETLYGALLKLEGEAPAAVGPRYRDRRTGKTASVLVADTQKQRKMMPPPEQGCTEVDMLITSGCLIPASVIHRVGGMKEDLFIDHVDMEWCFRARKFGLKSFVVGEAELEHCIGDNILNFLTRRVIVHSPIRHYYMLRNGIALQRLPHMTYKWRRNITLTLIKQFVFYSLFLPERKKRVPLMFRGIIDGFKGRLGPLETLTEKTDGQ